MMQVLVHGEAGEHPAAFRHRGDAHLHALVRGHVVDGLAVEEDAAPSGDEQRRQIVLSMRALAGPVGADAGEDLALVDLEVDVVEGLEVLVVDAGVLDLEQAHAGVPPM